jgi:oligopeptide transport system ATP-binding protein
MDDQTLLTVAGLKVHFKQSRSRLLATPPPVRAVDGIDFTVKRGETLSLVGESGCGKSTTGLAILQLHRPTDGSVIFDGNDLTSLRDREMRRLRRRMQMIFQDPYSSLDPRMTVAQIIGEALEIHDIARGREKRQRVLELLETVGLERSHEARFPWEFSGGQRQRIGIARALAVEPDFIVADEPISALDVSIQAQLINLLEELQERFRLTFLFIAHDLAVVEHISDRVAVMYLGKIVELADRATIFAEPLHPYTVALLSAVPVPDPQVEMSRTRIVLRGEIPSPANPPTGCRFHTRCWLRLALGNPSNCVDEEPELRILKNRKLACHWAEQTTSMTAVARSDQS